MSIEVLFVEPNSALKAFLCLLAILQMQKAFAHLHKERRINFLLAEAHLEQMVCHNSKKVRVA
jgi:hypothetical protein